MPSKEEKVKVTRSSGNVFADMGLPDPEEALLKARLASLIHEAIDARGWTQAQAATVLGLKQPDVSNLTRGRLSSFSVERLLTVLARLDHKVTISVRSATTEIKLAWSPAAM